eukprot:jgi/Chlat1/6766/Chrsp50S06467
MGVTLPPKEAGLFKSIVAKNKDGTKAKDPEDDLSLLQNLWQNVLSNPYIWGLALTYFCIYLIRQGITSWSVFYLIDQKGVPDAASAAVRVSGLELGGLTGSLVAGFLSDKLAANSKSGTKFYETKQYKKGLKAADQILKKFPDHGETLAMKGLTLNCLDRKAEAYELVRKGLKLDLASHVCWHVYGLLYRSDRDYREAIKCYRNALRLDKENIQILRDLSLLQVQMRDKAGFVETRRQLLTLKPNNRNNWIGFAIAQHLNDQQSVATQILDAYEGTLDGPPEQERYEHSEMLLYKAMLFEEMNDLELALDILTQNDFLIADKLSLRETRAKLLLKLGRNEDAEKLYRALLKINPDHYGYHDGLRACLHLEAGPSGDFSEDQVTRLKELYAELKNLYPKSSAVKRIPLDFLSGEDFRIAVDEYVRPFLRKGVPSLFSDVRSLYARADKADFFEEVLTSMDRSLSETGQFPHSHGSTVENGPDPESSALLFTLYFLAQHFDARQQPALALEKIDAAIEHTPSFIDAYLCKASILAHAGDPVAAAAYADNGRQMDLADRYLNSEAVKRMLRADQIELAEKTVALFTRDGDQQNNLFDMQCMWYEIEIGNSYLRTGQLGRALKKFLAVEKHYADMVEDQFDFHTYCLRKMTLRAYIRILRLEDRLHSLTPFCQGAARAVRCYVEMCDHPPKSAAQAEEEAMAAMSAADRKKHRAKQRKADALRAKREAEEKAAREEAAAKEAAAAAASSNKSSKKTATKQVVDLDPDGEQLLQCEDPLTEAVKYLRLLQEHHGCSIETHELAFEVYSRRKRPLLALQAVKRMLRVDPTHQDTLKAVVKYYKSVESLPEPSTDEEKLVRSVIIVERDEVLAGKTLQQYADDFRQANVSLAHTVSYCECLLLLSPDASSQVMPIVEATCSRLEQGASAEEVRRSWNLEDCIAVHKLLLARVGDDISSQWKQRCSQKFPFSRYFEGSSLVAVDSLSLDSDLAKPQANGRVGTD